MISITVSSMEEKISMEATGCNRIKRVMVRCLIYSPENELLLNAVKSVFNSSYLESSYSSKGISWLSGMAGQS